MRGLPPAGLIVLLLAGRLYAQTPQPVHALAISGNDRLLWVVSERWDSDAQSFLNWIAWMDPATLSLRPLAVRPQIGQVQSLAAWDDSLHLFVIVEEKGSVTAGHNAYACPAEQRRALRLPDNAVPFAMAGGSDQMPGLWALVDGRTAEAVRAEWEEYQRSLQTQPAEAEPSPEPGWAAPQGRGGVFRPELPAERFFLVVYDGIRWAPGFEAPAALRKDARAWMTVSGGQCHLFWQDGPSSNTVRYAKWDREQWREAPSVSFSARVVEAAAGLLNKQLVFAALVDDGSGSLICEPRVLMSDAQGWDERPPLKEADGSKVLTLPRGTVLSGFGDNLALLRPAEPHGEVGLWSPADGQVVLPFTRVPFRRDGGAPVADGARDMAHLLVIMGIVLLIYWRRREDFSSPVLLPPGLAAASFPRRGLAALIDMAPAALVVWLIWRAPLEDYFTAWQQRLEAQEPGSPDWSGLVWAWLCFALLYTAWCAGFELFMSASPGKRLLGCVVASESGRRPAVAQLLVRNALRVVELFPPLGVWPFLLVVLMTRNRQRVGDLLARTIVVERIRATDESAEDSAKVNSMQTRSGPRMDDRE